ncbi:MAG: NAD(P)-dependent oxidoreductase [Kiritimatiellia bacterium]
MKIGVYLENEPAAFNCEASSDYIKDFTPQKHQIVAFRHLVSPNEVIWCRTEKSFLRTLPTIDVAVVWQFNERHLRLAPNLRLIATPAAGREGIKLPAGYRGIKVYHGRFHGTLIAQTVLGALLAMNRGLFSVQGQRWPRSSLSVQDIDGTNAVILGYGAIGRHIGRLLKLFGVNVYGVRRRRGKGTYTLADLPRLLQNCDHFIMALPSDTGTDGLVDGHILSFLPRRARLYNVGRGNALDEAALLEALHTNRLAGAYLDVFAQEPLPDNSPLYGAPNLLLTPHASAFGFSYLDRFFSEFARHLAHGFFAND